MQAQQLQHMIYVGDPDTYVRCICCACFALHAYVCWWPHLIREVFVTLHTTAALSQPPATLHNNCSSAPDLPGPWAASLAVAKQLLLICFCQHHHNSHARRLPADALMLLHRVASIRALGQPMRWPVGGRSGNPAGQHLHEAMHCQGHYSLLSQGYSVTW